MNKDAVLSLISGIRGKAPLGPGGVVALYLYGSFIKGRLRAESDIDVAFLPSSKIAVDERLMLISKVEALVASILKAMGIQRDISVLDLKGKYVPVTLQYKVITEGMLFFERDRDARVEFENTVKGEYFDFMPFLESLREKRYGALSEKV